MPQMNEILDSVFRWLHVVAGVMWSGHLWFFNFVNGQLVKTYDADSKKKVVPELMPRALYWFRWGAFYTWVTGFLLIGVTYAMGGYLMSGPDAPVGAGAATGIVLVAFFAAFFIYDVLWKSPLAKNEMAGAAVSFILFMAVITGVHFSGIYSARAQFIFAGGLLGTIMMMNVWMRIWPAQRKIIGGIKGTNPAPTPDVPAMAGLRSKHNTYMSVPLIFFMVSNHFSTLIGNDYNYALIGAVVLVGWALAKFFYAKAASPAPVQL